MADLGNSIPAVGEYGYLTILVMIVLAILAAVVFLMIVRKDPRPGEVYIRIFYGLIVRVRWGQLDDQENKNTAAELPNKNIPAWKRVLRGIINREDGE
jgi:hypothetical protein